MIKINCGVNCNRNIVVTISFMLIAIFIVVFVYKFGDSNLSDEISDWGSFGAYFSIVISLVSIYLLFITYKATQQAQYDVEYNNQVKTLCNLQKELNTIISQVYDDLEKHFVVSFMDHTKMNLKIVNDVLLCYYTEHEEHIRRLFDYIEFVLSKIDENTYIGKSRKKRYITELSLHLNKESYLIYFIHSITSNNEVILNTLREYDFFSYLETDNEILDEIKVLYFPETKFRYLITNNKDKIGIIDDNVKIEEQFWDTYDKYEKLVNSEC